MSDEGREGLMQTLNPDDMESLIAADFRAWMLRFRHQYGRPLTEVEHRLAKLSHASGFLRGFKTGGQVMCEQLGHPWSSAAREQGGRE